MAIKIGSLQIDLRLISAKFEEGMRKADRTLGKFTSTVSRVSRTLGKFSAGIAALSGIGGAGLAAVTVRTIQYADSIAKVSDKLGLSTDALQTWRFAAVQTGVETGTLDMALQRLARRIGEVTQFGRGEAKQALNDLGIALFDASGNAREFEEILPEVSAALAQVTDDNEALALAAKLVDSEGVKLINTFRLVNDGYAEFSRMAQEAGAILDENFIRKAEIAGNQLDILSTIMRTRLSAAVLANADVWIQWGQKLVDVIGGVSEFLRQRDQNIFNLLVKQREALNDQIAILERTKDTNFIPDFLDEKKLRETRDALEEVNQKIREMSEARVQAQKAEEAARKRLETLAGTDRGVISPTATAELEDMNAHVETFNRHMQRLVAVSEKARNLADPFRAMKEEMDDLDEAMQRNLITQDVWLERQFQLATEMEEALAGVGEETQTTADIMADAMDQAARSISTSITNAVLSAELSLESLQDLISSILESIARQLIQQAVVAPVTTGLTGFFTGRQFGGPVSRGRPYIVGEHGPELFVPSSSGSVVSNDKSLGPTIIINDQRGADAPPIEMASSPGPRGEEQIVAIIRAERRHAFNSGELDRDMRRNFGAGRVGVIR